MKWLARISLAALFASVTGVATAGMIDPNLQAVMAETGPKETVSALVFLVDQVDVDQLTRDLDAEDATLQRRHEVIVRALQEMADATQGPVLWELQAMQNRGEVTRYHAYWLANVIRVEGSPAAIDLIAGLEQVDMAYLNYGIELIEPVAASPDPTPGGSRTPEPGILAVRAPEVWAMGYTGSGVLVANMDTGVNGNHIALASRWAGVADPAYAGHPEWAWYDPYLGMNDFPYDDHGHGTHTMGTVCGGAPGDEIGVAPGALWIASAPIDRGGGIEGTVADALLSFEWMADPDGNPSTNWDVPAVCSNSWGLTTGHGYPPCDELFWSHLDACEAVGCLILFSAGNEGSSGLRRPADRATDDYRTCAVAAIDPHTPSWPLASFSSQGPTYCTPTGEAAIKPDIAAPGVDIRSASYTGGYTTMSGTSMASPHVNGVVALVREACPDLTIPEIKQIIYETAFDLGSPGEDNQYGWGNVDAYEAVLLAESMCGPSPPRVWNGYYEVPVDTPTTIAMQAMDHDGGPFPISWIIQSLPGTGFTLTDLGNGHVITAGELPYTLVDNGNEVLYSPTGGYYGDDEFTWTATDGGTPPEGGESDLATTTILVLFDPPVITTEALPDGYLNFPYSATLQAEHGQPELQWSLITDEYLEMDLGSSMFETVGIAQGWHADDSSWQYSLPFVFPFFGDEYTTLWVTSNGFLNFGGSSYDWSNSVEELIQNTRICPLWDDLRTDQGGDIYIDASVSGEVTFRWDTETFWTGVPCNHSCTLYADGRIRFHYGTGNSDISPTIGISSGDGTHYLISIYNDASSLTEANSLEYVQPVPLPEGLMLDLDGTVSGTPTESGPFEPRVKVTDALGRSDIAQVTLFINESGIPGDVNGDGVVDVLDVLAVIAAWGECIGCPEDTNNDGVVDVLDLLFVIASWT